MAAKTQGVILDVDGTLVDSNDAHARAYTQALTENGYKVSFEDIRRAIGMGGDNLLPTVAHIEKDSPEGKKVTERRSEIFKTDFLPHLKPFPQARALLERMKAHGLTLIVATSAQEEEMKALLAVAGVTDLLDDATSSEDAAHSKPAPDPIQIALKKGNLAPERTYMLGDTPYDVESASKAGVETIAVRSGGWSDKDFPGARAIYDDVADLLAQYDLSPLQEE